MGDSTWLTEIFMANPLTQNVLPHLDAALTLAESLTLEAIAQSHKVFDKGQRDFALDTDWQVEQALQNLLATFTPEIPVLGEESWQQDNALPETFWVVDPIDGTVNFSRQMPLFGVTIALMHRGQAIAAGITFPKLQERYQAVRGQGATCNGQPLVISNIQDIQQAMLGLGDFSTGSEAIAKHELTHGLLRHYAGHCLRIRMLGSAALQLAWLAAGRLDMSITLSNKPWDVQAGMLLVTEAGGTVFDADGTDHHRQSRFTLASNPHLKTHLVNTLQQLMG